MGNQPKGNAKLVAGWNGVLLGFFFPDQFYFYQFILLTIRSECQVLDR